MLKTTMSTTFVPGTNLKGEAASANWTFLLPSLVVERVVCIGIPQPAALVTLARLAQSVTVLCTNLGQAKKVKEATRKRHLANVHFVVADGVLTQSLPEKSVDLLWLVNWRSVWKLSRKHERQLALQRLLRPEGLLYFEWNGIACRLFGNQIIDKLEDVFGTAQTLWLTPTMGEMETAVPLGDRKTTEHFLHQKLYSLSTIHLFDRSLKLQPISRLERSLIDHSSLGSLARRYGALIGRTAAALTHDPPQYLQSIAQESDVSLAGYRWGLSAPGQYNSRKVLFFLFERDSETPTYIVKMTRGTAFNARLENECKALTLLWEKGIGDSETLPQPVFFGHHSGLVIVGETVIDGIPFRQRTKATADCPYGRSAVDWLIELGAATVDSTLSTTVDLAQTLQRLFERFVEIYQLTPAQFTFLERQIATLANNVAPFPLVFQHGDPGSWNVMVTRNGRIAFLDWEAAEQYGMPLWDLFYFMRSYAIWAARSDGIRNRLAGFHKQLLTDSDLAHFLQQSTKRYSDRIGLSYTLIEPLFYTCWLHRSLKEATRLAPAKVNQGHYVNLLKYCVEYRNNSSLQHLFEGKVE